MNAIRRDDDTDNTHSIFVDQWDWEKVITREQRNVEFLKEAVKSIVKAVSYTKRKVGLRYPAIAGSVNEDVFFITTQELEDMYPDKTPKERETLITKEHGTMAAFEEPGLANAETLIERGDLCFPPADGRWREAPEGGPHPGNHPICRYTLHPRTGKTHQLRVHMNSLGLPIVGDDFYPRIQTRPYDDFSQPLQLVARMLRFTDPITGEKREFVSRVPLKI